jgi:hypothetical protein
LENTITPTITPTSYASSLDFLELTLEKKILTLIEGLARSRNGVGEKGLDTWDFSNDGAMFLGTELWVLKKNLYLKP